MSHTRRAKPWRPSAASPGPERRATLRKVVSILRHDVLPAVCARAEVFAAALSLLPLTIGGEGASSWVAIGLVLQVTDGYEGRLRRRLGAAVSLLKGGGRERHGTPPIDFPTTLGPILRRRKLVRAALGARLRTCRARGALGEPDRRSPADWELSWAIYLRPALSLEIELARTIHAFVEVNSRVGGGRPV